MLSVKPHEFFERDGNDLHCVIFVSFPQVALGDEIQVPTLEGDTLLRIHEGTQSGKEYRLRGKGVPHLNEHGRGDLVVQIVVQTPKKFTKAQRDLLRQLGRNHAYREQAHLAQSAGQDEGSLQLTSGSTIGVTGEDDSDGAFPQEKTHLAEPGWGTVIVEPL